MTRQKKELYEVLAHKPRLNPLVEEDASSAPLPGETPAEETAPAQAPRLAPRPAPRRARPEPDPPGRLVIRVETGLAVFLIVGALLATAFHIGFERGLDDVEARIARELSEGDGSFVPSGALASDPSLRESRRRAPRWPAEAYVLKLRSYPKTGPGLTRARADQAYVAEQEWMREAEAFSVAVLENDQAYTLCIGPVAGRYDPALARLKERVAVLPGPPSSPEARPYEGLSIEQKERLGQVIPE